MTLLSLYISTPATLGQISQLSTRPNQAGAENRKWIHADIVRLPSVEGKFRVYMPFSMAKSSLDFQRIAGEDSYLSEFDLSMSLYSIPDKKKITERDLRAQNRLTEQMKSYRLQITEAERNRGVTHQDFFDFVLPDLPVQGEIVVVFEKIETDGESKKEQFFVSDKLKSDSWAIPVREGSSEDSLVLINKGDQVEYGKDFDLFILLSPNQIRAFHLPESKDSLRVSLTSGGKRTEYVNELNVMTYTVSVEPVIRDGTNVSLSISQTAGNVSDSWGYMILDAPGKKLPNEPFELTISSNSSKDQKDLSFSFSSIWSTMPSSLLRLDVALDRLSLILPVEQVSALKKGSREDRIQAFYSYWNPLDPTPETHMNELMVEFYERIDRANQRFTTPSSSGSESDQGRQFILFGEPDKIERVFPTNGPSLEIWYYPGFMLTFEATSGFGDYKLIDRKTL